MISRKAKNNTGAAILMLLVAQGALAADIGLELEAGIGETDNITRTPDTALDPALDDTIYSARVALDIDHESARADVGFRGMLTWLDYEDGPYDSETLPALDVTAIFRLTDEVLSWFARGNVGQQSVDPFQPASPGNRQDVTYLTTGPTVSVPLGPRNALRGDAWYSDVRYESQPLDNNRSGAQLGFVRQISPARSLSLNARAERTEFDEDTVFPNIDRADAFIQFDTEGSRNRVTIDLGFTQVEQQDTQTDEPLATIEWQRQVSPATSVVMTAGTQVSDSADSFRDMQQGSLELGDVQNQQNVSAPFREDFAGVSVSYNEARTSLDLGGRWTQEDYEESAFAGFGREVQQYFLNVSRQLGGSWTLAGYGNFNRRDYDQLDRRDDDRNLGLSLTWQRLRTIEIELRLERFELDSTDSEVEFTERRAYLGFRYIPDFG